MARRLFHAAENGPSIAGNGRERRRLAYPAQRVATNAAGHPVETDRRLSLSPAPHRHPPQRTPGRTVASSPGMLFQKRERTRAGRPPPEIRMAASRLTLAAGNEASLNSPALEPPTGQ